MLPDFETHEKTTVVTEIGKRQKAKERLSWGEKKSGSYASRFQKAKEKIELGRKEIGKLRFPISKSKRNELGRKEIGKLRFPISKSKREN